MPITVVHEKPPETPEVVAANKLMSPEELSKLPEVTFVVRQKKGGQAMQKFGFTKVPRIQFALGVYKTRHPGEIAFLKSQPNILPASGDVTAIGGTTTVRGAVTTAVNKLDGPNLETLQKLSQTTTELEQTTEQLKATEIENEQLKQQLANLEGAPTSKPAPAPQDGVGDSAEGETGTGATE